MVRSLLLVALIVGAEFAEAMEARLYWTDKDARQIESSDVNGGNRVTILSELSDPRGIAVDPESQKMFWACHEKDGAIYWANCDGSNAEVFIASLSEPADLVLDLENRLLYWVAEAEAESSTSGSPMGRIQRASLDRDRQVTTVLESLNRPYYLALDGGVE